VAFEYIYTYSVYYIIQAIPGVVEAIVAGLGGLKPGDLVADLGSAVHGLHQSIEAPRQFML
jgi:hypothetical protein